MDYEDLNRVDWPDDEEIEREAQEDAEIWERMRPEIKAKIMADGLKNIQKLSEQTTFWHEITGGGDWPKVEEWLNDTQALANDFAKFSCLFKKLVNYDPDNGYYFDSDPPFRAAWEISSRDFVIAVETALAIESFPLPLDRLHRVVEIGSTYNKQDVYSEDVIDKEIGPCTRSTWKPRYTFSQQKELCSEAIAILETTKAALELFVKLKHRQQAASASTSKSTGKELYSKPAVVAEHQTNNKQTAWQTVFGMELSDAADDAHDVAYYAQFPAVLADELADDFRRFEQSSASTIYDEWVYWTVSPLTQGPEFYRLLRSLLPECPVDFLVFSSLRKAIENKIEAGFQTALDATRAELRLLGLWLESTGLWAKRPSESVSSEETNKVHKGIVPPPDLVTFNAIAERLKKAGCPVGAKRLSNLYQEPKIRAEWGEIDDKKGNAFLFEWQRLRPILALQFAAQLKRPLE